MPDQTTASPDAADISFDKAEYDSKEAPVCLSCKRAIDGRYYLLNGKPFCEACHTVVLAHFARKLPAAKKVAGIFLVLAAVVGCAAAWYAIREATGYEIGLIAIGVAYVIAKALRRASGGLGSRGLQLAAVALTYLSIAGSNVPYVASGVLKSYVEHTQTVKPAALPNSVGPAVPTTSAAPAQTKPFMNHAGGVSILASLVLVIVLALVAPFLGLPANFMGVLIIGIALYQAWRLTAAVQLNWEGPLSYEPPAAAPVPAPTLGAAPESAGGG